MTYLTVCTPNRDRLYKLSQIARGGSFAAILHFRKDWLGCTASVQAPLAKRKK